MAGVLVVTDRMPFPVWLLRLSVTKKWNHRHKPTVRTQLRELVRAIRILQQQRDDHATPTTQEDPSTT